MAENVILDVCNFLKTKNILIPSQNQWLRGCVSCFRETFQNVSTNQLKEFVLDQWKLADLKDICAPTLPNNCKTAPKLLLSGKYAVQINYIVNIGESFYKPLQKIRRPAAGDNLDVDSEKDKTVAEPATNRTLKLEITDGVVTVLGFEDKHIRKLVEPFVPGVKAILSGPFECRKGVLFLKNENIDIIGGEVDTLQIVNAVENILARKLNQPENPDPYKSLVGVNQIETNGNSNNYQEDHFNIPDDDTDAFLQVPDVIESYSEVSGSQTTLFGTATSNSLSSVSRSTNNTNSNFTTVSQFSGVSSSDEAGLRNTILPSSFTAGSQSFQSLSRVSSSDETGLRNSILPEPNQSLDSSLIELNDDDDETFALMAAETASLAERSANRLPNRTTKRSDKPPDKTPPLPRKQASLHNFFNSRNESSIVNSSEPRNSSVSTENKKGNRESSSSSKIESDQKRSVFAVGKKITNENDLRAQLDESYRDYQMSRDLLGVDESRMPSPSTSIDKTYDDFKNHDEANELIKDKKKDDISVFPPKKYPSTVVVKACVMKLLQKLSIQNDQWSLSALVKVRGVERDMEFSHSSLDKVFGMTASELQAKKSEVKQNPQLKEKINDVLKSSQRRIQQLDCHMKIYFPSFIGNPVIMEILD